jgi:hypothetical protein
MPYKVPQWRIWLVMWQFFSFFVPNSGFLICSTYFDKRSMIYLSTSLLMSRLRVCLSLYWLCIDFHYTNSPTSSTQMGCFTPTEDFHNLVIKLPTLGSLSYLFLSNGFFSTIFFVCLFWFWLSILFKTWKLQLNVYPPKYFKNSHNNCKILTPNW